MEKILPLVLLYMYHKKNRTENSFIDVSRLSTYVSSKLLCKVFLLNEDIILRLGSLQRKYEALYYFENIKLLK